MFAQWQEYLSAAIKIMRLAREIQMYIMFLKPIYAYQSPVSVHFIFEQIRII